MHLYSSLSPIESNLHCGRRDSTSGNKSTKTISRPRPPGLPSVLLEAHKNHNMGRERQMHPRPVAVNPLMWRCGGVRTWEENGKSGTMLRRAREAEVQFYAITAAHLKPETRRRPSVRVRPVRCGSRVERETALRSLSFSNMGQFCCPLNAQVQP